MPGHRKKQIELGPVTPPQENIVRILSLTGGGMRGLFTAYALEELERVSGKKIIDHFNVFAGTSVGGIIALGLAAGIGPAKIRAALERHGPAIFPKSMRSKLANPWNLFRAAYAPAPLQNAIQEILGSNSNVLLQKISSNLIVVSADHETADPVIFASGNVVLDNDEQQVTILDAAMATSAAQSYFPPHMIGNRRFVDGGLVCNAPDIIAAVRALRCLAPAASSLKLLGVGTTYAQIEGKTSSNWGLLFWLARQKLLHVAFELQQKLSVGLSEQLLGDDCYRLDSIVAEDIALDDASVKTQAMLKLKAEESVRSFKASGDAWHNIMQ